MRPQVLGRSSGPSAGRRHPRNSPSRSASRTAGGSFGQFAIVPFVSLLQSRSTSATTMFNRLSDVDGMVPVLPSDCGSQRARPPKPVTSCAIRLSPTALQEGFRTQASGLLAIGFFVWRLPTYIHRAPSPVVHFPTKRRHVVLALLEFRRSSSEVWAIGFVGPLQPAPASLIWAGSAANSRRSTCGRRFTPAVTRICDISFALPLSWVVVRCFPPRSGSSGSVPLPYHASLSIFLVRPHPIYGARCFSVIS